MPKPLKDIGILFEKKATLDIKNIDKIALILISINPFNKIIPKIATIKTRIEIKINFIIFILLKFFTLLIF